MDDSVENVGERGRHRAPRSRRPRLPLETKELVAYNWGAKLFDDDPARVAGWLATKLMPDERMGEKETEAWIELGPARWWGCAWAGLNDAAAAEAEPTRS